MMWAILAFQVIQTVILCAGIAALIGGVVSIERAIKALPDQIVSQVSVQNTAANRSAVTQAIRDAIHASRAVH